MRNIHAVWSEAEARAELEKMQNLATAEVIRQDVCLGIDAVRRVKMQVDPAVHGHVNALESERSEEWQSRAIAVGDSFGTLVVDERADALTLEVREGGECDEVRSILEDMNVEALVRAPEIEEVEDVGANDDIGTKTPKVGV